MLFPVRLMRGGWPRFVEARMQRFVWADPQQLLDDQADPESFTATMSALHVGGTIKTTAPGRHRLGDALLVEHVPLGESSTIVDVGASDGCTSLDLITQLPTFGSFIIADLYFTVTAVRRGRRTCFYDQDGTCILVAGPRVLAWPATSGIVRALYRGLIRWTEAARSDVVVVTLLNPLVRSRIQSDPRIRTRIHDVFEVWTGPTPDVIKVANLLRRIYFDDETITRALRALFDSLPPGGYLLVVDNPRGLPVFERAGLYQRDNEKFTTIAEANGPPEIADLVALVGAHEVTEVTNERAA